MDSSVKVDLRSLEKGISLIERAHTNGLQLVPNGSKLQLRKYPNAVDYNKEQATVVAAMLKQSKQDVLAITADPAETRKLLAESQRRLAEANEWFLTHLDLWDRLEKIYRAVFETTECVMGAGGCLEGAVVRCRACEGVVKDGL